MSSASQSINSLPNVRVFFGFLFPLFSIFDDYWYYSYHNRDYKSLFITATFFQMIQDVNNQKMIPSFIDTNFTNQVTIDSYVVSDYSNYTNSQILLIDGGQTYFVIAA